MLTYFETYIKPANDQLGRLLAEVHCNDCGYISRGDGDTCPICGAKLLSDIKGKND